MEVVDDNGWHYHYPRRALTLSCTDLYAISGAATMVVKDPRPWQRP